MDHKSKNLFVEERVLKGLQKDSFESKIAMVSDSLCEHDFGNNEDLALLATRQDDVVLFSENGQFYKAPYSISEGVVKWGKLTSIQVSVVSEDNIAASGVDAFYSGKPLADSIRGLLRTESSSKNDPFDDLQVQINDVFSDGSIWRSYMANHRAALSKFAWDARYGSLTTIEPAFEGLMNGTDEKAVESASTVMDSLLSLEERLGDIVVSSEIAYEDFVKRTNLDKDPESVQVVSMFDTFATDYLQHMNRILGFVSNSIKESQNGGCILCSAKVHDAVAMRFKDLDLAGRFIRKVTSEFNG